MMRVGSSGRWGAMGVYDDVTSEGTNGAQAEAALAAVSASAEFVRAPVMRRLLDYLVRETLAGRGDQVKAYSVAVDGLGRDPDFDTQADSYPRVQVGRLRRMLDAYYARNPLISGIGLSIPNGSYKVRFFTPGESAVPPPQPILHDRGWNATATPSRPWLWPVMIVALALLMGAAMLWIVLNPLRSLATSELVPGPVLEAQRISADGDPRTAALAGRIDLLFGEALYRSFVTLIQPDAQRDVEAVPDYRLVGRVASTPAGATLFIQLHHVASGRQIWSEAIPLPADDAQLGPALRPAIARMIQPFGLIATDQRARFTDPAAPGFPCLVLFLDYHRTHDQAIRATVDACLERTARLDPARSNILSARSYMAYDASRLDPAGGAALRRRGAALAREAVRVDPFSGAGHYALATAFYFEGRCDLGKASATRSIEMNPYNAEKLATLGAFMFQCGDPDAENLLREAIALDPTTPAHVRTPLILLLIRRGSSADALALANAIVPPMDSSRPYYDLTMALAQAANGDRAAATASWQRVRDATGGSPDRLDAAMSTHAFTPGMRRGLLKAVAEAGLARPSELPKLR